MSEKKFTETLPISKKLTYVLATNQASKDLLKSKLSPKQQPEPKRAFSLNAQRKSVNNSYRPLHIKAVVTPVKGATGDSARITSENYYAKHLQQTYQALKFIHGLPNMQPEQIHIRRIYLPPTDKKTLIFDLDETLVHCCSKSKMKSADKKVKIPLPNGKTITAGINIRPFVQDCLQSASAKFEVIAFTASQKCYADAVLDLLDPRRVFFSHRLYREHCILIEGIHVKDLRILGNRALKDITLVDNAVYSFAYQVDNGVPIISWFDDKEDNELQKLIHYFETLAASPDVRELHSRTFKLSSYLVEYEKSNLRKG